MEQRPFNLAIISKGRMAAKFDIVLGLLNFLHEMATDKGARGNLRRAINSTKNAARVYGHCNLKEAVK